MVERSRCRGRMFVGFGLFAKGAGRRQARPCLPYSVCNRLRATTFRDVQRRQLTSGVPGSCGFAFFEPAYDVFVDCWIRNSPNPKCMLCDFRWPDHRQPPARFFFARAWHDGPKSWLVGGVCPGCDRRPDLVEMFNNELRQHFPGGQLVDGSHQAPGRMQ
jgi:hypothetical protein